MERFEYGHEIQYIGFFIVIWFWILSDILLGAVIGFTIMFIGTYLGYKYDKPEKKEDTRIIVVEKND